MATPPPSQYDAIGSRYTHAFKALPTSAVETTNLRAAVAPHVRGARALDLGCGTGYYSRKLLEWGAAAVVGVDVSPEMVAAANSQQQHAPGGDGDKKRLRFIVGDAVSLGRISLPDDNEEGKHGAFDLATGAWLLNYASSAAELTRMFATIAANLRLASAKNSRGGVFVGITPPPVGRADMDALAARTNNLATDAERTAVLGYSVAFLDRLASGDGWKTKMTVYGPGGAGAGAGAGEDVTFQNYHLAREVYEDAARRGGLSGRLEWRAVEMPAICLWKSLPE
ncbi:S-adenosyl-L-methionine-dependent methyltransferase [Lasiosphaeria miniovina]|uniref:S-adenosyl-L-methionine-dependent methyltransferase n=1 Tax=Lasiosphaeria miniovina TaxID=1954250 RepID=A0AA40AKE9_9PEZI|nr:S-adenosyl-L-methionine-dependent methyltransferase [Lasiosphaeria miniovina]KAK0717503.1 S-adenosyl-L-methionine-dependent methyltransferase [Lasiosphaeria miniovina]